MIVSTPPPTHPPTHPPRRSLHHSPHHSPYHILHSSTPPPIPLSHSHTQAFRHVCSHRSDNLKGHIHTYFRGQLMHLFSSLASHQSARCIPTYSSSCVCQVSHQSARCIPTYSSSCACLVSHQSASHLGISSVSQVAASAAQVFASPCVLQFVFVAALRLK